MSTVFWEHKINFYFCKLVLIFYIEVSIFKIKIKTYLNVTLLYFFYLILMLIYIYIVENIYIFMDPASSHDAFPLDDENLFLFI